LEGFVEGGTNGLWIRSRRASGWIPFIERLVSEGSTPRADGTHLRLFGNNGEQDVYNLAVIKHPLRSAIVYQFPCRWNVQLIGGSLCLSCVVPASPPTPLPPLPRPVAALMSTPGPDAWLCKARHQRTHVACGDTRPLT